MLKYNIPKQKEKTQQYVYPPKAPPPATRSVQTANLYWHFCESSPSISHVAKRTLCCSLLLGFWTGIAINCTISHFALQDWTGQGCQATLTMQEYLPEHPKASHRPTWCYLKRTEFCWTATSRILSSAPVFPNKIRYRMQREDLEGLGRGQR